MIRYLAHPNKGEALFVGSARVSDEMMAVAHCKLRDRFHALCEIGVDRGSQGEEEGRNVSNAPNLPI